jgi:hypothetical protein
MVASRRPRLAPPSSGCGDAREKLIDGPLIDASASPMRHLIARRADAGRNG